MGYRQWLALATAAWGPRSAATRRTLRASRPLPSRSLREPCWAWPSAWPPAGWDAQQLCDLALTLLAAHAAKDIILRHSQPERATWTAGGEGGGRREEGEMVPPNSPHVHAISVPAAGEGEVTGMRN